MEQPQTQLIHIHKSTEAEIHKTPKHRQAPGYSSFLHSGEHVVD